MVFFGNDDEKPYEFIWFLWLQHIFFLLYISIATDFLARHIPISPFFGSCIYIYIYVYGGFAFALLPGYVGLRKQSISTLHFAFFV